ncbi:HAD-IB family hydrolase [Marinigracilibium pacificum]|uniref:Haloacid dehalogenase-like hydrolase n=1 Tax=Marinigracilibium pacificum TaxID=2729599 RepID=A0A848IY76_9BACT|nr:HAD-IB family hydrolase [Marinigracilibium pacificum]NMM47240.1 haloacid dehalogenase-like hydrolase [Marinigracilibium pacificum]
MEVNDKLALFDFDGTITKGDTFIPFIKFVKGEFNFWLGIIALSPFIIFYFFGIISNSVLKRHFIKWYFKGMRYSDLKMSGQRFANEILPGMIRPKAITEIQELKDQNYTLYIVTASNSFWIAPWSEQFGFNIIATEWEVEDGLITGDYNGENCYGEEKRRLVLEHFQLEKYIKIVGYGDTKGDIPMLSLCHKTYFKPFI